MQIAVDALPINNFSGRRVLLGHLRNLSTASKRRHRIHVFHHAGNRDLRTDLGADVQWIECEHIGAGWARRLLWQRFSMQSRLDAVGADVLVSTSGAMVPGVRTPQVVLAQNPWCFFPRFHGSASDRLKARMQRIGYRNAQRSAEAVFYLSDYMADAYWDNAKCPPRRSATVLVGIDDAMFEHEARHPAPAFAGRALEAVVVSAMTPHKSVEDIVDAMDLLRSRGVDARLSMVGPWSDADYRASIENRIADRALSGAVRIVGGVSNEQLIEHYRSARAFILLSRCESFGIPSVESQVFGTPAIVADVCAAPEIAGPGGVVVPPGDIGAAADALQSLLTDEQAWSEASSRAKRNADRFRWSALTGPMIEFFDSRDVSP